MADKISLVRFNRGIKSNVYPERPCIFDNNFRLSKISILPNYLRLHHGVSKTNLSDIMRYNIMTYDVMIYDIMTYDVMTYVIRTYDIRTYEFSVNDITL